MAYQAPDNNIPLLLQNNSQSENQSVSNSNRRQSVFDDYGLPARISPKKAKFRWITSRKHVLLKSLIHLPGMAITIAVLSLTFRNVFWEVQNSRTNTILSALQFAAQIHGKLIIISLSAIFLYVIHHGLRSDHGLPLGFLSSSFQLDSMTYVFSREFASLITSKTARNIQYVAIFIFLFLISIVAQPSSAITMIPRLQFWPIQAIYPGNSIQFRVYAEANQSTLFPSDLTRANIPPKCFGKNATLFSECPSGGIRSFMGDNELFLMDANSAMPSLNVSIQDGWNRYLVGTQSQSNRGIQSVYTASTLSNFVGRVLNGYYNLLNTFDTSVSYNVLTIFRNDDTLARSTRFDLSFKAAGKEVPMTKPMVEIECGGFAADATDITFPHDEMMWPPWSSDPILSTSWTVPSSQFSNLSQDVDSPMVNFTWIDISQFDGEKPSLLGLWATPTTHWYTGCETGCDNFNFTYYGCTIDARWMYTKAFYDSSSGIANIYDTNPEPNTDLLTSIYDVGPEVPKYPTMYIYPSYAEALSVPFVDGTLTETTTNMTVMEAIGDKCLKTNGIFNDTIQGTPFADNQSHWVMSQQMAMLECFQVSLSVYLTDALSRLQESTPVYFVADGRIKSGGYSYSDSNPDIFAVFSIYDSQAYVIDGQGSVQNLSKADFQDTSRFLEVSMPVSRWGYGYGLHQSTFIYFAVTILLLHVALALAFIIYILSIGDYKGGGWETIGELIALCVNEVSAAYANKSEQDDALAPGSSSAPANAGVHRGLSVSKPKWTEEVIMQQIGDHRDDVNLVLRKTASQFHSKDDSDEEARLRGSNTI